MKKVISLLGICALSAFGAIPETAEDWYKPPEGWGPTETKASWQKGEATYDITINQNGDITENLPKGVSEAERVALESALVAIYNTKWNQERIKTLGDNLHKVFSTDGITISGQTPDGSIQSYTIKFKSGIGESSTIQGESNHMQWNLADEKSLELLKGNKIQIRGWDLSDSKTSFWDYTGGAVMFRIKPDGNFVHYFPYHGVDKLSLAPNPNTKQLELESWSKNAVCKEKLSNLLQSPDDSLRASHHIVTRVGGRIHYLPIGAAISAGGVSVDGTSITTNLLNGAEEENAASLYGWASAPTLSIPYKASGETLDWVSQSDIVDNKSIGLVDGDDALGKFEVKGASLQAANNRYFGTPQKGSVNLGWYDLPNVTTNYIEGDEKTLTTVYNEGGVKKLGWKHWPLSVPSLARSVDGEIQWLPLELPTNITFTCDNVSIATNKNNELTLKDWEKFGHGVIGKAENGSLVCKEPMGTNGIEHIENEKVLAFGLAGFEKGNNCKENLAELMRLGKTSHQILARYTSGEGARPVLHYLPIGNLAAPPLDNITLKTNDMGNATIAQFEDAEEGEVLTKRGDAIAWEAVTAPPVVDELSITTNVIHGAAEIGKLSIYGFDTAPENTAPHVKVDEYGGHLLEWRATSGTIRVIGTDETEAVIGGETARTNTLTFASAPDSNVKVNVTEDGEGNVKVTIGVYYLTEDEISTDE